MTWKDNLSKLLIALVLLVPATIYAIDDFIVTIKQVSSSGKSIIVDTGHVDNLNVADYGVLVQKLINADKKNIFKPIAKLRAVKVSANESVWVAYETYEPKEIQIGRGLFLFTESEWLRGKAKLTVNRLKFVSEDEPAKELADFLAEGDSLRKKENYEVIAKAHDKESILKSDVELIDVDKWENKTYGNRKGSVSVYRSPYVNQFRERKRVDTFEKMLVAFLNKYNNPSFDYDEFYKEQKRMRYSDAFQQKSVVQTYNDLYEKKIQDKLAKEQKFQEKLKTKGEAWSDDYSDEELSELLNDINVVQEKQRRRRLVAYKFNSQAYLSAGFNLVNNQTGDDAQAVSGSQSDVEIAWEVFLLKKYNDFKQFTFESSLRRATDGFEAGGINVASTEYSMALQLNWYPYYTPEVLERNIIFLGVLYRFGYSRIVSDTTGEEGNYQLSSLPGIRAGIKYNFKSNIGLRLYTGVESIKISRITRSADDGALPNSASYLEGKVGLGISKFF